VPIASLIINDRTRHHDLWGKPEEKFLAVIDGKQRITTVLMFFGSQFKVPGAWFDHGNGMVAFNDLTTAMQRGLKNRPLAVAEGSLRSLEEETEVFELVNFGGVPQGASDHESNDKADAPSLSEVDPLAAG